MTEMTLVPLLQLRRKKMLTIAASAFVLFLMIGYLVSSPKAAIAFSVTPGHGTSEIYGNVTSNGLPVAHVMVKLEDPKGKNGEQVVAVAVTDSQGDFAKLSNFTSGTYTVVMRSQTGTVTGSMTFTFVEGKAYDISAHIVQSPGSFFFLPIFSY